MVVGEPGENEQSRICLILVPNTNDLFELPSEIILELFDIYHTKNQAF